MTRSNDILAWNILITLVCVHFLCSRQDNYLTPSFVNITFIIKSNFAFAVSEVLKSITMTTLAVNISAQNGNIQSRN